MSATHFWSRLCVGQEEPQNTNYEALGHAPPTCPNNYGYSVPGNNSNPPPTQYSPPQQTLTPQPSQPSQAKPCCGNGKRGNKVQKNIHDITNKTRDNKGRGSGAINIGNFGQQDDEE